MEKKFVSLLRDPFDRKPLLLVEIESSDENVIQGILVNHNHTRAFPIISGVPVLTDGKFPKSFNEANHSALNDLKNAYPGLKIPEEDAVEHWSFSQEWEAHTENEMEETWGMSKDLRYKLFLAENQVSGEILSRYTLLDAGCGNGIHTEFLSAKCEFAVGIDFSQSVFDAEKRRKSKNLLFIRGDLQHPPLADDSFDIVISNGVIHHTPDTEKTFEAICTLPKVGGTLYLWLYNRQGGFAWRFKRRFFNVSRSIVCRFNPFWQKVFVNLYTTILHSAYRLAGKKLERNKLRIDMYDSITPRWRHYHEPIEVWNWYKENGFHTPCITSWDTLYGYGILGRRKSIEEA